jgi:hypothetical protein
MTSLKLYKLLQDHTGKMNSIVVKLTNEQLTKEEALTQAAELLAATTEVLAAG